jgi:hypothetical protein
MLNQCTPSFCGTPEDDISSRALLATMLAEKIQKAGINDTVIEIDPPTPPSTPQVAVHPEVHSQFCGTEEDRLIQMALLNSIFMKKMEDAKIADTVIDLEDEVFKSPPRHKARLTDSWFKDMEAGIAASLAQPGGMPLPEDAAAFDDKVAAGASVGSRRPEQVVDAFGEDAAMVEPDEDDLENTAMVGSDGDP